MSGVSLFFIGAVLLCNGLTLLGRMEPKAAAPVNAMVGLVLVATAARLGVPADADESALVGSAGFLLFGLTYLWVALTAWTGHSATGLGWYCGWATAVSLFLGGVTLFDLDDAKFALLWLLWAVLFGTFFTLIALERSELAYAAGWLAILEAAFTASGPGALLMTDAWDDLATAWVLAATVGVIAVFLVLARRARVVA